MNIYILAEVLAWSANLLFIYGAVALAKKHITGWHAQILANIFYIFQSIVVKNMPLLALSVILCGVGFCGLYSWTKKPKKVHESSIKNHAEHSYLLELLKYYNKD